MIDLLIVGGGINGAGIARDAAGRGLKVLLCEQHDLAAHTSSASTKLIHGGLRYLEFMEFSLVRKALAEREVLFGIAPHIMYPLRFVMPHDASLRPAWMIRAGLFLYDHLARRRHLAESTTIDLRQHPAGAPLLGGFRRGFEYSDGWVDDARLVVLNALDAHERGADIRVHTRCESLSPLGGHWQASLLTDAGRRETVAARAVVNATGPWAASVHAAAQNVGAGNAPRHPHHGLRLVKGSHIVVRTLFDHDYAYIFQADDRRIVFAIPYEGSFTLIGTTDIEYVGPPESALIDAAEIEYLCRQASRYFRRSLTSEDVVHHYSGVRPLLADESSDARSVSRDYALELQRTPAPMLSVFGGKITTYRTLGEEAVNQLAPLLGVSRKGWTDRAPLPGGDLAGKDFAAYLADLCGRYSAIPGDLLRRYARAYGSRCESLLTGAHNTSELGREIAAGLYERELDYLTKVEWARSAEDILWRRSKLGLHLPESAATDINRWLTARLSPA